MKHTKKLLALALVMVMAFAAAIPTFALKVEDVAKLDSIYVPTGNTQQADLTGHKFALYQIFKGEYNDGKLTQIGWGAGFANDTAITDFIGELQGDKTFGEGDDNEFAGITYNAQRPNVSADAVARVISASDWADTLANGSYGSPKAKAFADIVADYLTVKSGDDATYPASLTIPANGYYLVKDVTPAAQIQGGNTAVNMYVLEMPLGGEFQPRVKADVPELVKQVLEVNDSAGSQNWGFAADYDIGDNVYFALTGTMPTDYAEYETYKYVFHDTLSAGLALNADSFKVYLGNRGTGVEGEVTGVASEKELTGYALVTTGLQDESFTLTFENLKDNPEITAASYIRVVYTAKLNPGAVTVNRYTNTAHLEFSNDPNPQGEGTPPTGNTPDKTVTVFTFTLNLDKVDDQDNPLAGAGFTLYKRVTGDEAMPNGEAPAGTPATVTFKGDVTYKWFNTVAVNENGTSFTCNGLDSGDYVLVETTVPSGYNRAEEIFFTVKADLSESTAETQSVKELSVTNIVDINGQTFTDGKGEEINFTFTANQDNSALSTKITNLKGVVLPSTGGIGTTIFYVVGGLLLVGASVVLITKKRMKGEE